MTKSEINFENYGKIFKVDKVHFDEFTNLLKEKTIQKSEYFLEFGKTCNHLGFVVNGTLRSFYISEEGVEKSFNFHTNNHFFTNYESFLQNTPSKMFIQAVENTEVLLLHKIDLKKLFKKEFYWQEFGRIMAEIMFLESQKRIEDLLYFSPEKRYLELLEKNPNIFQKIPQKHIASYLGITPQSLSRIKKRISKS